jgi:hypothetical protein
MSVAVPLRLVTGEHAAAAGSGWTVALAAAGVVACLVLAWMLHRRSKRGIDARDEAFAAVARGLRLSAEERRAVRRLCEAEGSPSPVAVVLCRGAMAQALARQGPEPIDREATQRLVRRLFGGVEAAG